MRFLWVFVGLVLAATVGWVVLGRQAQVTFPELQGVTKIVVRGPVSTDTLREITDPAAIDRVVAFVNARRDAWETPWYGVPVPAVIADFYGSKFLGHFGAGATFFETQRLGLFVSRRASEADLVMFAALLGIDRSHFTR